MTNGEAFAQAQRWWGPNGSVFARDDHPNTKWGNNPPKVKRTAASPQSCCPRSIEPMKLTKKLLCFPHFTEVYTLLNLFLPHACHVSWWWMLVFIGHDTMTSIYSRLDK